MTERAIKPKQPIKRRKKTAKSVKTDMPQPNSAAEAAIFVGSLGMALYAVFMFMLAFVALAFNDTGRSGMEFASLVLFLSFRGPCGFKKIVKGKPGYAEGFVRGGKRIRER